MKRTQLLIIVCVLIASALGIFFYKVTQLGFPVIPDLDSDTWTIESKVSFRGRGDPVTLRLALPESEGQFSVVDESFIASGFGIETTTDESGRRAIFERRAQDGSAVLFYRAKLISVDRRLGQEEGKPEPEAVSDYRRSERRRAIQENATPLLVALDSVLTEALEKSAGERSFITQLARISADEDDDRITTIIEGGPPEITNVADRLVFLLNAAGTPARLVQGILLDTDTRQAPLESWVEYWLKDEWVSASPRSAEPLDVARALPIVYDRAPIVDGDGFRSLDVSWSVARNFESQLLRAMERGKEFAPWVNATSLLSLPIDLQLVFRVLLLIPLGALVIVLLKQIIGMPAFGTFMPILIALAFRETSLVTGMALFVGIVSVGLFLRSYFNQLQLLLVPRLAAVLIIVTFLMMFIALAGEATGIQTGLSISLFPLVIITMTIERMSLTWEEDGAKEALKKAAGSLAGAVPGYFILTNEYIEHVVIVFPELLLIVLAIVLMLGRYTGYKLTEFFRFRVLAEGNKA
ncbi:UUP1 family membrane protein [Henriciella aquimarina]|uniref:UUP1 family membrane protein n=1 Tax=Henriciella aquimarina TaxID=545261 RepID=UPI0009FC83B7|nr:UUP1 family membrane protein [Henriciella aquimarina]